MVLSVFFRYHINAKAIKIKDEKITEASLEGIQIACLNMVKIEHPKIRE